MAHPRRSRRLVALTWSFLERPSRLISLSRLGEELGVAKSSLSEDAAIIDATLASLGIGRLETVAGAAGGLRLRPELSPALERVWLDELARRLADPERILPGGYLYMSDIIFDPLWAGRIGWMLASRFREAGADRVVTVETKGIPLGLMTARALDLPLVVIRHGSRVSEGSSVSVNYLSGSGPRIQTMSLARRALAGARRALVVDDFLRGGGTALGVRQLLREFDCEVAGLGVLAAAREPREKRVEEFVALIEVERVDEAARRVELRPLAATGTGGGRERGEG
ncbi:MAG: pur operon repressor [Clostridia bacterium]|nr:pur operon repressor [Clostridia bacterium]MCL6521348.1 pur operon repressor [Bacillota bacterium]